MELENLPEGWEIRSLGEVTNIIKGKKPKTIVNQKMEGYVPYILIESFNKVYSKFTNELSCPQCNRDDIIMVMDGASSGLIAIGLEGVIGSTLAAIKPKGMIDSDYLFYWLKSKYKILNKRISGSTIPHVDKNLLKSLKFPIPPLEEQKKIVEILQFADYLKERRREAIKLIDKIVMSVFYDMFGDPVTNPKGWEVKKLGEVAQVIMGQSPPGKSYNKNGEGHPFLQGPTEFGKIFPIEERWTTQPQKFCDIDDILISVRATIGETNWADKKYCIGRGLAAIRANPNDATQPYLWYILKCFRNELENLGGGSVFKSIKKRHLEEFEIPLPPLDLQQEFAEIVSKLEDKRKKMEEAEEKLEMLYQILLKQAFTGKLTEEWRMRRKEDLD